MSTISRPICCLFPLAIAVLLLFGLAPARAETFQLQVRADPMRLAFGPDNHVTLSVTVRDNGGLLVPDGTPVYFHTTLGNLPNVAYTKQGEVSVLMDNSVGAGTAKITVTVGDSREVLEVEYLGQGGKAVGGKPARIIYHLKAQQVYYSVDQRILDMRDSAEFSTNELTITADAIQYSVNDDVLTAQDNITITNKEKTAVTCKKLRLILGTNSGALIIAEPEVSYQSITLPKLTVIADEAAKNTDFKALNPQPTKTWILCKQAVVFPHTLIQFRRPQFYVDKFDRKLYTLPYHVMDLRSQSGGLFLNSQVSLTSDAGLDVDFPVYFDATPDHIGSLHLRHVAQGTSGFQGDTGFQVGLEEEYLRGNNADGAVYLDDLVRPTRSLTWEHNQDFGKTSLSMNTSYQRYSQDTPYTTRVGLTASRNFGDARARFTSDWSDFAGNQDGLAELSTFLPSLKFGKTGLGLNFSPYLGYQRTTLTATDTAPAETTANFYQGLRVGMEFPTIHFLGGTISPSLSNEVAHDQDGTFTNYLDAGLNYQRPFLKLFTSTLSYGFSKSDSTNNTAVSNKPSQRLSLNINGHQGTSWNLYTYSNYSFDTKLFYHSINATYYLPWFRKTKDVPRYYMSYRTGMTSGNGQLSTSDQLVSLGWNIGSYGLLVHYSPTGNTGVTGIGTGTGKKWAFELVRQGW